MRLSLNPAAATVLAMGSHTDGMTSHTSSTINQLRSRVTFRGDGPAPSFCRNQTPSVAYRSGDSTAATQHGERDRPYRQRNHVPQRVAEGAPYSCIVSKLCNPEVRERSGAQPHSKKDDDNRDQRRTCHLPAMRIGHEQPEINGGQHGGIAHQVQQPQLRHATMFRASFHRHRHRVAGRKILGLIHRLHAGRADAEDAGIHHLQQVHVFMLPLREVHS